MKTHLSVALIFTLAVLTAPTGCKDEQAGTGQNWPPAKPGIAEIGPDYTISLRKIVDNIGQEPLALSTNWNQNVMNRDGASLAAYSIHFAFDSAEIRDRDQANLQAVASVLQRQPNTKLLIEGNCDERGTEEYNRSLGERRALSSREALAKLGVDSMRIATISYGKDKPLDPGHNEDAWSKNRRDDYVLLLPMMATNFDTLGHNP